MSAKAREEILTKSSTKLVVSVTPCFVAKRSFPSVQNGEIKDPSNFSVMMKGLVRSIRV